MTPLDFETCLIREGLQSPPPVCVTIGETLHPTFEIEDAMHAVFESGEPILGHNVVYDMCVTAEWYPRLLPLVFDAYDDGRILCTRQYERLGEIAGRTTRKILTLDNLVSAYGLPELDKDPAIRLTYGQYLDRPLSEYSKGHRVYALADVACLVPLHERQSKRFGEDVKREDWAELCRADMWLTLCRNWGLRTDPERIGQLEIETAKHVNELRELAREAGLVKAKMRGRAPHKTIVGWSKDMKALRARVEAAYEGDPPLTKKPKTAKDTWSPSVSTARVTLEESGDFVLEKFAEYGEWSAVNNKDLPMLRRGAVMPIHTKFGIADTTRTTSSAPNVQNFRRKAGIRECVVPRAGHCFVAADWSTAELAGLGQVILWELGLSGLADRINAGVDLHSDLAKEVLGTTYAETLRRVATGEAEAKNARNCAKPVNFGKPGGMADATMVLYAKASYKVDRPLEFWERMGALWAKTNPECVEYLRWIRRTPKSWDGRYEVVIPATGIIRRGATYCAAANTRFQGIVATMARRAGWLIARAMYCGNGPLSRARMCNFVHDEFILEARNGEQTEVADALVACMSQAACETIPDVRIEVEATAMDRWSKNAKRLVENGELLIWSEDG